VRILVAGGAGMIGSTLCLELLSRGHRVICVDNLVTGRVENLDELGRHQRFEFVKHDVVHELPPFPRLNRVYHLASPASPPGYTRLPIETLRANSEGTRLLLEVSRRHGARFLYASTSEVYGDPMQHPQREEYRGNVSSIGPRSMYDEAKRYGEAIVMAYVRSLGANGRIVRIFNTYGPRCDPDDGRLVVNLVGQAVRNQPMTLYGDGLQTRSLCYVSDTVEGLIRAMETRVGRGQVINIGNPDERTVREYALLIRELVGSDSPFVYRPCAVADDPHCRRPDIDKARRLLKWEPLVSLREGLTRTIDYLRAVLQSPAPARRTIAVVRTVAAEPLAGHGGHALVPAPAGRSVSEAR